MTPAATRSPALFAAGAMLMAGALMSMQARANGSLAGVWGHGVYAALTSFGTGAVVIAAVCALVPSGRRGLAELRTALTSGEMPWWTFLGGLMGTTVVIAQAFTVSLTGVAIYTMSFVCGQLIGALLVDATPLPPGGPYRPSAVRVLGTLIVIGGVSLSAVGSAVHGVPLWAPFIPLCSGTATAFQQALNGRVSRRAQSGIAATCVNFCTGTVFLIVFAAVVWLTVTPPTGAPQLPGQWWMLLGGVIGVVFIATSTTSVMVLGVLLISLFGLLGNLTGSLIIDAVFAGGAPTTWTTYASMALVVVGVVLTVLPAILRSRAR